MMTLAEKRAVERKCRKAMVKIFENLNWLQKGLWEDDAGRLVDNAVEGLETVCKAAEDELYDNDGNRLEFDEDHAEEVAMLEEVERVCDALLQPLYDLQQFRRQMAEALLEDENERSEPCSICGSHSGLVDGVGSEWGVCQGCSDKMSEVGGDWATAWRTVKKRQLTLVKA